ncbi:MAG TPA: hypothetical protein VJU84_01825 [Pyrinomonadaceae bacterium]|nr:hypothetical protein [Pyrinomonadaceae bacterium]
MINTMQSAHHSFKLVLLLMVLVCIGQVTIAQSTDQNFAYPKRPFKHDGKFGTEYEPREDNTIVTLEPVVVEASPAGKELLRLAAVFQYPGKVPTKPKHISLGFYGDYPQCRFSAQPKMTVLVDGERIEFGWNARGIRERKPDEEGVAFSFNEGAGGARCEELMFMTISQKNFLRVVNAKNVEMQIDELKFKLTEANLEALRDLASRMLL